jgi:hypothetical protein
MFFNVSTERERERGALPKWERTRVHVHRYAGDAATTRKRFFLRGEERGFVAAMQEGDQRGLLARLTSSAREGFGDQQRAGASWMRADGNVFSHSAAQCSVETCNPL